jgi:hypothetical protein
MQLARPGVLQIGASSSTSAGIAPHDGGFSRADAAAKTAAAKTPERAATGNE